MEPLEILPSLPDGARVWMYAADRPLNASDQERLLEFLETFCATWQSHGRRVESGAAVFEDRFAVIAGDIPGGDISGCGIDASVHLLDRAAGELGVRWLPALHVHFRGKDGSVVSVPRSVFRSMAEAEEVNAHTRVFDLSVATLGELRHGRFERPAELTWHARVFRLGNSAAAL